MTERDYYFWIGGVSGWTWRRNEKLFEYYNDFRNVCDRWSSDRALIESMLTKEVYEAADASRDAKKLVKRAEAFERSKINFLTPADAQYPDSIRNMGYDVPFLLTYAGDPALLNRRNVAIVGSRRSSAYGARMTELFAKTLGSAGLGIVSGLAYGIDSHAHRAALSANAPTVAVLGSGLRHITPPSHTELAREIVRAGGLVLSEFDPDFGGSPYSYPQRNRLIAALSEGVILVEAGIKSGALYTVDHAVEQGKDVFLIPAELDSQNFLGLKSAYESGKGNFVFSPEDVLSALGIEPPQKTKSKAVLQLDMNSQKILDSLSAGELNYDSLFESAGLTHSELGACLTKLELFGLIGARGNYYYRIGELD